MPNQDARRNISGMLFNIQHFSVHDGPGVRSVVFFKGCNLRCAWCHNPESISAKPELLFYPERCIGCGKCIDICPHSAHAVQAGQHIFRRELCVGCMVCADYCYAEALAVSGISVSQDKLMKQLLDEKPYYGEQGGVTFSGGDAMLQIDFLECMLAACTREGIHCAIDTAGNVPWEWFERVLAYKPMFLYDVKAANPEVHRRLTGVDNVRILENLRRLSGTGARLWIRVPLIPGYNSGEMNAIAAIVSQLNADRVEIMGYHRLGETKYAALGRTDMINPETPSRSMLEDARAIFQEYNVDAII
ncbi:pyruvate formate lyase-activating protein [Clostridia bacterium]|nr:pyruvate formate lyase-activating protein [Clostridia bacterium]